MAGKAVKCPGCGQVIRVPGGGAAKAPTRAPATTADTSVNELFDEEGMTDEVAGVCPACRAQMKAGAILCTKCGYNKETGERLQGHKTAGVDIDFGELALMKAETDLADDKRMQEEMLSKAGLPWWGLALVLFVMGTAVSIAVITINAANREEGKEVDFDPIATFYLLTGIGFATIGGGALLKLIVHAIKKNATKATIIKLSIFVVVMIGIAIGFFVAAANR